MKAHRYLYLYLPISRFFSRLSPQAQTLLLVSKLTLLLLLLGFEIGYATNLI